MGPKLLRLTLGGIVLLAACQPVAEPLPPPPGPSGVDVYLPEVVEGAPTVVVVHGGGWVGGEPLSTAPLAAGLADRGALTFNLSYRVGDVGGYPQTFDDIACGIRYALAEADRLGAEGGFTLVGHSAGAHMALVVALSGDTFGGDCAWDGPISPDLFVGLAGFYRIDAVEFIMRSFLGGDRTTAADAWAATDLYELIVDPPEFPIRLIHGTEDRVAPLTLSTQLLDFLTGLDATVELIEIEGATHGGVNDPDTVADVVLADQTG